MTDIAWSQIVNLKKEFEHLKKNQEDSGVLKAEADPDNN